MGLEDRRGKDKPKSITKTSKLDRNLDQNVDDETFYEEGKGDDDLENSSSGKSSSVHSTLSLKLPTLINDGSVSRSSYSSAASRSEKNNSKEEEENDDFAVVDVYLDNVGVSRNKSSKSVESKSSSSESVTFPVYKPHVAPIMQSPPPQVMDRTGQGYDPFRIPADIFKSNKSVGQIDWSIASNESLFSLHLGNSSFSSPFSDNPSSANKEENSEKPSPEKNLNSIKKKRSCDMSTEGEVAVEIVIPTEDEIIKDNVEEEEEEYQKEEIAIPKPNVEVSLKKTTVKWKSNVTSDKSEATEVPQIFDVNNQSATSYAYPVKRKKCSCSSFYCSNCSLAYCSNCSCASCYCSNCSWAYCYCWNCTKRRWCLCECCQPSEILSAESISSPKKVDKGLSPIAPESRTKTTSKRSCCCFCFSCSCLNCFACLGSESYSCRSCCSRSCFSCQSCIIFSKGCFQCPSCSCCSCQSCSCCCSYRCSCLPSSCCCCTFPRCKFSSCCPSNCCCCCFSCSSCCPFESISFRLCTSCSICRPWSFSCYPWRGSFRRGHCCCGSSRYCSCRRAQDDIDYL